MDGVGDIGLGGDEGGTEPRGEADEVVGDEDLAGAMGAAADADGWDGEGTCDFCSEVVGDEFEDDSERAEGLEEGGIGEEGFSFFGRTAFDAVAAFFADALGEHTEMAEDGNAVSDEGFDLGGDF